MISRDYQSKIFSLAARASKPFLKDCLWRVNTEDRACYLSFDDGPDLNSTPTILDLLDRYEAKASFFLIGSKIEQFPNLAQEISERGHVIGNHSFYHRDPWKTKKEDLISSFERTQELLRSKISNRATGIPIRPPFGHVTSGLRRWSKDKGLDLVMWDVDPCDYRKGESHESISNRVFKLVRPGSIILMHDREDLIGPSSKALDRILSTLQSEEWTFPNLSAELKKRMDNL